MVDEVQAIDLEAVTAFDQRRLLAVLDRAIGEEAVGLLDGTPSASARSRARLEALCRLMSMIRETADAGACGGVLGEVRRTTRTL